MKNNPDLSEMLANVKDNKDLEDYYRNLTENSYTDLLTTEDIQALTPEEFKELERFQNIKKMFNN